MLKISEMARLANTTRRTLIFYDKQGIFRPQRRDAHGYRYYDYNQLYNLTFILGLRSLGVSLDEIKKLQGKHRQGLAPDKLVELQTQINHKIDELTAIQTVINHQLHQTTTPKRPLDEPFLQNEIETAFWCSQQSVNCTEEEVAQLFAEFYQQFNQLAVLDTNQSGFLTNLGVDQPDGYPTASFRIIREVHKPAPTVMIPSITKPAGLFVGIRVENTLAGIHQGLTKLRHFCQQQHLQTENYLWQINDNNQFVTNGASQFGILEFRVSNRVN
ncbi:MerR family transcriptional regulator [Fructilactobacillus cliffordii]|uniref:MerR family transcriptional regulator n=1 Tax=Fructilactobacillus cliffordii TaxID=2940299 RepID=UPI00209303AD|nr:MerR family transcriptional regulator [Fructilactobacillus cliffordii]USS86072.1 MerR family transcriptional regulator [Fructilactobacillus cliffordii]